MSLKRIKYFLFGIKVDLTRLKKNRERFLELQFRSTSCPEYKF